MYYYYYYYYYTRSLPVVADTKDHPTNTRSDHVLQTGSDVIVTSYGAVDDDVIPLQQLTELQFNIIIIIIIITVIVIYTRFIPANICPSAWYFYLY